MGDMKKGADGALVSGLAAMILPWRKVTLFGLILIVLAASAAGPVVADDKTLLRAREGAAALLRGQYEKAIAAYDEALANPEIADFIKASILSDRGIAKWGMKQTREAIEDFNLSIQLNAESADVYNNRGNALLDLGHPEEAIKDFDRAISLKPNYGAAYNNRGNAHTLLAQYQPAFQDYRKAVELMPTNAAAFNGRGKAHAALKRQHAAVRDFTRAISINAKYGTAFENRGRANLTLDRYREAAEDLTEALATTPDQPELLLLRARANLGDKKLKPALDDLNRAIELKPDLADAYIERGLLHTQVRHFDDAIADFTRAIELKPENAKAYAMRAAAQFQAAPPKKPAPVSVVTKAEPGAAEATADGTAAPAGQSETVVAKQSTAPADSAEVPADGSAAQEPVADGSQPLADGSAPQEQMAEGAELPADGSVDPGQATEPLPPGAEAAAVPPADGAVAPAPVPEAPQPDAAMMADAEKALSLAPDDANALRIRADIHRAMERNDAAIADYQRSLTLDPFQTEARTALEKLGQEMPAEPGEPLGKPVKEWVVKEVSPGRFMAANPRYKALRVELEMFGSGQPKILEWSLMRDALAGIGLLRYYAGDFGDGGKVDLVYTAIVDLYANKVIAIEPYSWGSTEAAWNWQGVSVIVTDPEGNANEVKLRRGRTPRSDTREETADYGFPFFGQRPGGAPPPRQTRRAPPGGQSGVFNWLFR